MTKLLAFDCFNTLIDNFDEEGDTWGLGCIAHLPVNFGLYKTPHQFKEVYKKHRKAWFKDLKEVQLLDRLVSVLGNEKKELASYMVDSYKKECYKSLRLTPGAKEMLARATNFGRLCVVSNYFLKNTLHEIMAEFGIIDYFEFVLASADFGYRKPSLIVYEKVIESFRKDVRRADITFLGDNLVNDVLMPIQLGMDGVYLYRPKERLQMAPIGTVKYISKWEEYNFDSNVKTMSKLCKPFF